MSTSTRSTISYTQWVENNVRALYAANSEAALDAALDDFLSEDAQVLVNGNEMTYDQYKAYLLTERIVTEKGDVQFVNTVGAPVQKDFVILRGSIGAFFNAVVYCKTDTSGSIRSIVTTSLNVVVEQLVGPGSNDAPQGTSGSLKHRDGAPAVKKLTQVTTVQPALL